MCVQSHFALLHIPALQPGRDQVRAARPHSDRLMPAAPGFRRLGWDVHPSTPARAIAAPRRVEAEHDALGGIASAVRPVVGDVTAAFKAGVLDEVAGQIIPCLGAGKCMRGYLRLNVKRGPADRIRGDRVPEPPF